MAKSNEKEAAVEARGAVDPGEEYVDFMIPLGADNAPVFLGVNGETVRIRPGETVSVRRKFVEVWQHAQDQQAEARRARQRALAASKKALAEL